MAFVYYVQPRGGGPVKIGWSRRPVIRLTTMQTFHAEPLVLLAVEPDDKSLEAKRHAQFATFHLRGEWFAPGTELVAHLTKLAKKPGNEWTAADLRALSAELARLSKQKLAEALLKEAAEPPKIRKKTKKSS